MAFAWARACPCLRDLRNLGYVVMALWSYGLWMRDLRNLLVVVPLAFERARQFLDVVPMQVWPDIVTALYSYGPM